MEKKNLIVLFIAFILIGLLIMFMPKIYQQMQKLDTPTIKQEKNVSKKEDEVEKITLDSDIVKNLTYPIMRNDKYSVDSYYQLDSMTVDNLSNNDILYNAFLDMYDGYLVDHNPVGCTNNSKEFKALYLMSRIKNIIGRNVNYTNEDFVVPNVFIDTDYVGTWKYNSETNSYVYYGNCNNTKNGSVYYDLLNAEKIETANENNVLYLYYKIAFVKLDSNGENYNYKVYSDAEMKNEIATGTISDINKINDIYNSLDNKKLGTYKYTFKKGLCTYDNYCFYKGEWVND